MLVDILMGLTAWTLGSIVLGVVVGRWITSLQSDVPVPPTSVRDSRRDTAA